MESIDKIKSVISGESQTSDFLRASDDFKNALVIYQKEKQLGRIPSSIDEGFDDIISFASTTIDYWPQILGFDQTKNYLILFQNNMELRPGGGFIGSYGLLTLDRGRVIRFSINDVYDADGQLKSHFEPPFAIRRYLPSVNWYLRDSNFNADFSKNATSATVFLSSETGESVDGVIGVDLTFVKNLLAAIGPVEVLDYKKTVNENNLFEVTQSQVEEDFFPGSTQKKDFLKSLFNSISLKMPHEKNISYLNILQGFASSLSQKHVLFAFNDTNIQTVFAINGWGGTLLDNRKTSDIRVNDFLGLIEANLGANKVNYYISKDVSQSAVLKSDGTVSQAITISYRNKASKKLGKQGIYKNYLRIILPKGASIKKISIDGKEQNIVDAIVDPTVYEKKGFVPPSGLELEKTEQGNKTTYGFLTIINPETSKTITIDYFLQSKLNLSKSSFTYDLKLFKQAGVDEYPYKFSLSFSDNLSAINLPKEIKEENSKIEYKSIIQKDEEFIINLSKE